MWIYLGLLAAFFLCLYNLCKKISVNGNAVVPCLLLTTTFYMLSLIPFYVLSKFQPDMMTKFGLDIPELSWRDHFYISIKSMILSTSWLCSFYAMKNLPITIFSPIRATGPFFTFLGAIFLYGEHPSIMQMVGFFMIIISMFVHSNVGKKEGIYFRTNKGIYAIIIATIFGASSGLYDKFLIQYQNYNAQTVQFWYSIYVILIVGLFTLIFWLPKRKESPFVWRWSIPLVGIFLAASDFFYFFALQDKDTMIILLSALKRSQVLMTVIIGGIVFHEKNKRKKLLPLFGILCGVALIMYAQ